MCLNIKYARMQLEEPMQFFYKIQDFTLGVLLLKLVSLVSISFNIEIDKLF